MFKSLRWKLEFFYAGLLTILIVSIGSLLYYQVWRAVYDEFDQRLVAASLYLDLALRAMPPMQGRGNPPPPRDDGGRPPPRTDGGRPPPRPQEQFLHELKLPEELNLYQQPPTIYVQQSDLRTSQPYFLIFSNQGELLKQENLPESYSGLEVADEIFTERPTLKTVLNNQRETYMRGPRNTRIVVGKSLVFINARMNTFGFRVVLVGSFFITVGIFFSFAIASRMVRPLAQMSAAAELLSEKDLGRRLDIKLIDSELVGLAEVLNCLFSRLDASFTRQRQFTADASHELRTPLTVIRSVSELALSQVRSPLEYQETIEVSLKAAERMTNLVNGLLALARLDSSNADFHLQQISLNDLVSESVGLLGAMAAENQVGLVADLQPVQVFCSHDGLSRMVDNLITNAIIYNKPGGKVFITLTSHDDKAVLEIKDTGVGISEEHLPFVFERFYRIDKARSRVLGGSGLGLAICKGVIEKHYGTITAQSVLGEGTTFRIQLPIWKDSV